MNIQIVASRDNAPPFPVEALVFEEDTALVLSADRDIRDIDDHPIRVMTSLYDFEEQAIGDVLVCARNPYRFLAVVHDFDREPSCQEAWIEITLSKILRLCRELEIESLGLQMLGTRFGRFTDAWFSKTLAAALAAQTDSCLKQIWLMLPAQSRPGPNAR